MNAGWRTAVDTGALRCGAAAWHACCTLARSGLTIVVYMGIATLPEIVAGLRAGGMAGDTPAAAIQHGTTARQEQVITTLVDLPSAVAAAGLGSPAILVIGAVVSLAELARAAARQFAAA
jgi:uroporphyrin-III C-methyltransferase